MCYLIKQFLLLLFFFLFSTLLMAHAHLQSVWWVTGSVSVTCSGISESVSFPEVFRTQITPLLLQ